MIGGHWGYDADKWADVSKNLMRSDAVLLLGKFLWRQGYVRCPDSCSADTPQEECSCSCPTELLAGRSAEDVLALTGMDGLDANSGTLESEMAEHGLGWEDYLELLCHVGLPGEMFTSAAPQDPTFWPIHGNAERFVQYARLLKAEGTLDFDESWGYQHATKLPSDTGVVCDWTNVTGMGLPTCEKATCAGHKADDLLPFEGLMTSQAGRYSNAEFYNLTSPLNTDLPYVYGSLSSWPGCTGGALF